MQKLLAVLPLTFVLLFTIADNLNILNCKKRLFVSQYKVARLSVHDVIFTRFDIAFFVLGRILSKLEPTTLKSNRYIKFL